MDWAELKQLSAEEVLGWAEAQAVGEEYAAKVRAIMSAVIEVARSVPAPRDIEVVVLNYLAGVVRRPAVSRVSTVMWHGRVLSTVWPELRRSSRMSAFMKGLCMAQPAAPERAGVEIERDCDLRSVVAACNVLMTAHTRTNLLAVQAVVNIMAGGRLRETVRAMALGKNQWRRGQEGAGLITIWVDQAAPKDDLEGVQPQLRPKAVAIPVGWLRASPGEVRLKYEEQESVARTVAALIRGAGGVRSVTAARRKVAAETREAVAELGGADLEAMEAVRDVLGHVPNSASTLRYLPERLGRRAQARLAAVAMRRASVGGTGWTSMPAE
jgi:hypothetical protein